VTNQMNLGDKIVGTDGTYPDYIVVASSGDFRLAVKPIVSFIPESAAFGFGLRFRAMNSTVAVDPECHAMIWGEIPFHTKKPTHASASVMTHSLPANLLGSKGNAANMIADLEEKKVFEGLATFVMKHFGVPNDLHHLEGDAITQGLREIMLVKLQQVESEIQGGAQPDADPDNLGYDFMAVDDDDKGTVH
jgi:hypothetical protein